MAKEKGCWYRDDAVHLVCTQTKRKVRAYNGSTQLFSDSSSFCFLVLFHQFSVCLVRVSGRPINRSYCHAVWSASVVIM